jgi:predicted RNA-binding protein with EMAP domain
MGRTIPPVRHEIESRLSELRKFLTALRKEDREHFSKIYSSVKKHISATSYAHPLDPNELMQWSAILELEKKIERIRKCL